MNIDLSKYETITSHGYPSGVYRLGKYSSVWLEVEGTHDGSDIYDVYALSVFSGDVVGRYWLGNSQYLEKQDVLDFEFGQEWH